MEKDIRRKIREMIQLINDDALFRNREIPGDQDEFEDRDVIDVDVVKHDLYSIINDLIEVYDRLETPEDIGRYADSIKKIKQITDHFSSEVQ